jgi:predicted hydrolase (HD superfamily)
MGVIKRKKIWKQHALMQHDDEQLLERALRVVDTRGVVMREAEAELRRAIAAHRAHPTPEREQRLEHARRAFEEAKGLSQAG